MKYLTENITEKKVVEEVEVGSGDEEKPGATTKGTFQDRKPLTETVPTLAETADPEDQQERVDTLLEVGCRDIVFLFNYNVQGNVYK